MTNQTTMTKVKDCKHSVPFKAQNPDAPVGSIYVGKSHKLSRGQEVVQHWNEETITFTVKP